MMALSKFKGGKDLFWYLVGFGEVGGVDLMASWTLTAIPEVLLMFIFFLLFFIF